MPGRVPGIHVLGRDRKKDVDGRVKPRHDGMDLSPRQIEDALGDDTEHHL